MLQRVILMGMDQALSNRADASAQTLAVGSYQVPLLWLAGFDRNSLVSMPIDEDTPQGYPVFCDALEHVQARYVSRREGLDALLGAEWAEVLDQWQQFLQQIGHPYLAVDTYELWKTPQACADLTEQLDNQLVLLDMLEDACLTAAQSDSLLRDAGLLSATSDPIITASELAGFGWNPA